jgi:hypothetical protein
MLVAAFLVSDIDRGRAWILSLDGQKLYGAYDQLRSAPREYDNPLF